MGLMTFPSEIIPAKKNNMNKEVSKIIVKGKVADYAIDVARNCNIELSDLKLILKQLSEEIYE